MQRTEFASTLRDRVDVLAGWHLDAQVRERLQDRNRLSRWMAESFAGTCYELCQHDDEWIYRLTLVRQPNAATLCLVRFEYDD
jgi:hypothetical protein